MNRIYGEQWGRCSGGDRENTETTSDTILIEKNPHAQSVLL